MSGFLEGHGRSAKPAAGLTPKHKKAGQMPFPATPADDPSSCLTLPEKKGKMVEPRRIELPTYALRTRRSPS